VIVSTGYERRPSSATEFIWRGIGFAGSLGRFIATNCIVNYTIGHYDVQSGKYHQTNVVGEQLLRHALLDLAGFGEPGFQSIDSVSVRILAGFKREQ